MNIFSSIITFFLLIFCAGCKAKVNENKLNDAELARLRAATLNCNIAAFENFMPNKTKKYVKEFDSLITEVKELKKSIYLKARNLFGDSVILVEKGIKIPIIGQDKRWNKMFGSGWENFKSKGLPLYFNIKAWISWDEECDMINKLHACLATPSICDTSTIKGSVLSINTFKKKYEIYLNKSNYDLHKNEMLLNEMINMLVKFDKNLGNIAVNSDQEELKINLGIWYFEEMKRFMNKMKKISSESNN